MPAKQPKVPVRASRVKPAADTSRPAKNGVILLEPLSGQYIMRKTKGSGGLRPISPQAGFKIARSAGILTSNGKLSATYKK